MINSAKHTKVLIIGSGPIGTLCTLLAKNAGASHITVTDIQDNSTLAQEGENYKNYIEDTFLP